MLDTLRRWAASAPSVTKIGRQHVIKGDCLVELKGMTSESVDIVVTSPPYNIGVAYKTYNDNQPREHYLNWVAEIARELARVLKPESSLFLDVGSTNSDPWIAADIAAQFRSFFILQNQISWVKSISVGEDTIGHFKPITSERYLNNNHETVFHFTKSGTLKIDRLAVGVPFKDKTNIGRWGHKKDRRCAGNVWFIPYQTVQSKTQKFNHPAGFPPELPERCIRLHGIKSNPLVLDPFLGAGSTLVAAARLGCEGIGIEIDSHYVEATIDRLQAALL